nr:MAG TPA: hypothetical protein [Caudoviricetes sp.]
MTVTRTASGFAEKSPSRKLCRHKPGRAGDYHCLPAKTNWTADTATIRGRSMLFQNEKEFIPHENLH